MNRSSVKRCKERCLEEAVQLLRHTPEPQMQVLQDTHLLLLLVRLLISLQLQMVHISTACRKVDQVSPTARLLALHGVELQLNLTATSYLLDRCCSIWQRWTGSWCSEKPISVCSLSSTVSR